MCQAIRIPSPLKTYVLDFKDGKSGFRLRDQRSRAFSLPPVTAIGGTALHMEKHLARKEKSTSCPPGNPNREVPRPRYHCVGTGARDGV